MRFEEWKSKLISLDRYENSDDAKEFSRMIEDIPLRDVDERYISLVIDTFSDEDDYGIQECVLLFLDKIDENLYYKVLANKFDELLLNSSRQEWPLIMVGRVVNSGDEEKIIKLVAEAKRSLKKDMLKFFESKYFLSEYPEIGRYL